MAQNKDSAVLRRAYSPSANGRPYTLCLVWLASRHGDELAEWVLTWLDTPEAPADRAGGRCLLGNSSGIDRAELVDKLGAPAPVDVAVVVAFLRQCGLNVYGGAL